MRNDPGGLVMWQKLRKWFGLEKPDPFVRQYFFESNIRSSIYMTVVVIILEVWMITNLIKTMVTGNPPRTNTWLIQHGVSYVTLLVTGVSLLIYAIRYIRGKNPSKKLGNALIIIFSVVCIMFGIYISYLDYIKGEQILAFLMMIIYVCGLYVWHPLASLLIMSVSFGGFYLLCNASVPATYATQVNLFTVWIAVFMVSLSIFQQKRREAEKEETVEKMNQHLQELSVTDELTGISNMHDFRLRAGQMMLDADDISSKRFLFLDIENFRTLNEKYGFREGNVFLQDVAAKLAEIFEGDPTARLADDHFVVFTDVNNGMHDKLDTIREYIRKEKPELYLGLKCGAYIPRERLYSPSAACDRARYACNSIKNEYDQNYREYDKELHIESHRKQHIVNHIDKAIEDGEILVYYQPVVWAKNHKLCGLEALARWDDVKYGFLSPGDFIPVLEEYRQIYKLDKCIVEMVCRDIRKVLDVGLPMVPVSVNFSRLDFELFDIISYLEEQIKEYQIPKDYIHVEITESALVDHQGTLKESIRRLESAGYLLWLDDFGSGYSSLNVLKDYQFEVMKLDMGFLSDNILNERSRAIIDSVIKMADEIGMRTLTEGVETEEIAGFLEQIGCERLQGYLFGKPQPAEDITKKIREGTYTISEEYA